MRQSCIHGIHQNGTEDQGWGINPIEALHCDIPVLLSDLPVFQEVYEDSVLYHNRFDKDDMKYKLEMLNTNHDLQKKILNNGKLKIKDFTSKLFATRILKAITS